LSLASFKKVIIAREMSRGNIRAGASTAECRHSIHHRYVAVINTAITTASLRSNSRNLVHIRSATTVKHTVTNHASNSSIISATNKAHTRARARKKATNHFIYMDHRMRLDFRKRTPFHRIYATNKRYKSSNHTKQLLNA